MRRAMHEMMTTVAVLGAAVAAGCVGHGGDRVLRDEERAYGGTGRMEPGIDGETQKNGEPSGGFARPGMFMSSITHAGKTMPYVVYVPPEVFVADAEGRVSAAAGAVRRAKLPLIVFLHGSGESGTDGLKPMAQGLLRAVAFERKRWPAVVVAPQKASSRDKWIELDGQVLALVDGLMRDLPIDAHRVYLTGLSQGGYGAWEIGAKHAERWAAVVPICGWADDPAAVGRALVDAKMPVWAFHGEADDVVRPEKTRQVIDAHRAAQGGDAARGPEAKMTIYPGVNHNSWDRAYGEAELAEWMFSQRRE